MSLVFSRAPLTIFHRTKCPPSLKSLETPLHLEHCRLQCFNTLNSVSCRLLNLKWAGFRSCNYFGSKSQDNNFAVTRLRAMLARHVIFCYICHGLRVEPLGPAPAKLKKNKKRIKYKINPKMSSYSKRVHIWKWVHIQNELAITFQKWDDIPKFC